MNAIVRLIFILFMKRVYISHILINYFNDFIEKYSYKLVENAVLFYMTTKTELYYIEYLFMH